MNENKKEDIEELYRLINEKEKFNDMLKKLKEEFENKNKDLIDTINLLKNSIDLKKQEINVSIMEDFNTTGNKKYYGGIMIKEYKRIQYDEKKAFNWATNHNMCLKLDTKNFEKIAKLQDLDFVVKDFEYKLTYPKVLKN